MTAGLRRRSLAKMRLHLCRASYNLLDDLARMRNDRDDDGTFVRQRRVAQRYLGKPSTGPVQIAGFWGDSPQGERLIQPRKRNLIFQSFPQPVSSAVVF